MKILNSHIKNLLTSLLLMVGVFTGMQHAQAQQYPVQGFLSIIPPYPAQLADYSNPNINRLNLTLTLNDISVNNKRVRLKVFVLRQNSLFTQTSGNYFGDMPVILTSGIPEQLTSNELAGYFKLQNLQGIVPDSYAQPLGEGFMNIYFVVYDYFTGRQLSNKIEFPFFILLNDPPLLNLPLNGAHISNAGAANPQIAFSWTSRATQVSNTDYIFTLSPIYDPTGDPFTQFLAAIPVYQTTISNQTNLLYGFAEPPLLPGKTYGWRIQAKAKAGFEDVGLYKQNGYSEIHTFTYDNPCITIGDQDVTVEARASDRLYVQWQPPTDAGQQLSGGYMVAYRKYSAGGMWNWQEQSTQNPNYYITGLEPTTDYEVKVARTCTDGTYTYTNPQKATTLAVNQLPVKIDCGKVPSIDISNQNPLPQLNSGDVVMAGDFPVTILRANNVAGRFSGEGWVKVPYLADTKIHVTYQNIKVNTDHKLIDGYFETSYKASGQNIASVDTLFADVGALLKQVKYLLGDVKNWISDTTKTVQNIAIVDQYIDSAKAKNPTLADSLVNAVYDDLDSLQNISKTISNTTDTAAKNKLTNQADQVAKTTDNVIESIREAGAKNVAEIYTASNDVVSVLDLLAITPPEIIAFLSPGGEPIYLKQDDIQRYIHSSQTGVLKGFVLKNGQRYQYSEKSNTYVNTSDNTNWVSIQQPVSGQIDVFLLKRANCQLEFYRVSVPYPNTQKIIPTIADKILPDQKLGLNCVDKYFVQNGSALISYLQKIYDVYEFYKDCKEEKWAPYNGGVVPYCFWNNSNISKENYYTIADRPFTAGVIDGLYGQVNGLYNVVKNFGKIVDAFGGSQLYCADLIQTEQDYQDLEDHLKELKTKDDLWSSIVKTIDQYRQNNAAKHILFCFKQEAIRDSATLTIDKLYDIVSNEDKLNKAIGDIALSLGKYFGQLNKKDELSRYRQGKMLSDVATLFIGAGEAEGAEKMVAFDEYLAGATTREVDKAGEEFIRRVASESEILDDIISTMKEAFPSNWKFNKIGEDAYEVFDGVGNKWGTVYENKIIAPGRTTIGTPGNPIINSSTLVKNIAYEVDGFIYQTDELGRVFKTTADLDDIARVRLGNQQIRSVDIKDGIRGTDQGGHIIASRFFGPGEQINLYPQSANLNQGAWKTMENNWAEAMVQGKDVKVEVDAIFIENSKRPNSFVVKYTIDGQPFIEKFTNQ